MLVVLHTVYSLPFLIGAVAGLTLQRLYACQKCRWDDRHHPLPDGQKHLVVGISRIWVAGLAMVGAIGYVLLSAQETHEQTIDLTKRVSQCWEENYRAAKMHADIADQDSAAARTSRDLMNQLIDLTGNWIGRLANPPADIAALPVNDPRRTVWGIDVTRVYVAQSEDVREQMAANQAEQDRIDADRKAHPLPEMTCGAGK